MKTILIVDDAPDNIQLFSGILKEHYSVKAAINGELALKIMGKSPPPDLVLLDIQMPGMDGFEVCQAIRADDSIKDTPVIFITGDAEASVVQKAKDVGGNDYLQKPVDPEVLLEKIGEYI
jgi:putative two-component system response regulator